MVSAEDCLRHAAQCQHMANISRDPQNKPSWSRMATRWIERARSVEVRNPCQSSHGKEHSKRTCRVQNEWCATWSLASPFKPLREVPLSVKNGSNEEHRQRRLAEDGNHPPNERA
jgi:hypothetical protein